MEVWTITKLHKWTSRYLNSRLEAEILIAYSLKLKRIELYINHERVVNEKELADFKKLIQRRKQGEPIAYITGTQPFMSLEFFVDRSVLIPRPETERLVEVVIDHHGSQLTIADIGTGSGAIAISLAKYLPEIKVIGIDTSPDAIKISQKNAEHHKVSGRCEFRIGNLLEPLKEKVDLIASNPPYIPTQDIETLETDVKDWEPIQALDGGVDGLDYIRKLVNQAPDYLNSNGRLLIEIGFDQGGKVKSLVENNGKYKTIEIIRDLSGKDRILKAILQNDH
ncbi:MAG: peptide chain release factor N(5)-glutamine methyltransferase [Candidatus Margulisiibacteriota bacterium]|nr:peptide chain release factor N(5)-glutamine methyltransferase [Candidatus Margulisiibacteriota bacterium]